MAIESPVAKQQFFDANGSPLVGGKLYIYEAGTTTPATTWTDKLQTAANANPIILDSRGECVIWLDTESAYKYVLKTALDVEVYSVDNVNGALAVGNLRTDLAEDEGSSLIGYIAEGTGAVATTVQDKLRESVSVEDYGAVGNGIVDDTFAFEAAIAAATGEIIFDTSKTYAVNLVITKRGIRINGRSGDNLAVSAVSGSKIINFVPYDINKPVIQIGNDTSLVGGVVIENLSIASAVSPTDAQGTDGLVLAGGAYGNTIRNVQIGNKFSGHNLKLTGGDSNPCAYNQLIGIQLWTLADTNLTATLGVYYGATYNTANFISNFNITGPSGTGTGYAILIDSATLYATNGWVQASNNKGILMSKTQSANPLLSGANISVDSGSSSDVLITSTVATDTDILPVNYLSGIITIDGKYKNAALTETDTTFSAYLRYQPLLTWPVIIGAGQVYNRDTSNRVTIFYVSGANDNLFIGNSAGAKSTTISSGAGGVYLAISGNSEYLATASYFIPYTDNARKLGSASNRWSTVYAGTGTINTSDKNEKQDVLDINDAEKKVALKLKYLIKKFRFKDAVAQKNQNARIHIGIIAQDVQEAFESEGLDATKYGLFCSDILENGSIRLGIRYEELFAFIISSL